MQERAQHLEALRCALRQRGWRTRDGAQFGADLLLYSSTRSRNGSKGHQASHQRHAPFVLLLLDASTTWRGVCAVSRLAASVGKELLLAAPVLPGSAGTAAGGMGEAATVRSPTATAGEEALSFRILRLRRFVPPSG